MNRLWVSAPLDRIQRGGGSVVVSSAGAVNLTPASGQSIVMPWGETSRPLLFGAVADMGANEFGAINVSMPSGSSRWPFGIIKGGTPLFRVTDQGAVTMAGDLTVSGTGTHTFSGPVSITPSGTTALTLSSSDGYARLATATGKDLSLILPSSSQSLRLFNGASDVFIVSGAGNLTVSGTGTHTFSGPVAVAANGFSITGANAGFEVGSTAASNTPYIDFHSSGNVNDFDARIIASGGSASNGVGSLTITSNNAVLSGTLTASGTGTHTFSGPVRVSTVGGNAPNSMQVNVTDAARNWTISTQRGGANRFISILETNNDTTFFTATGIAGSESYTESYRIENSTAYVKVATRLGIGVSPSYPLHVLANVGGLSAYIPGGGIYAAQTNSAYAAITGFASAVGVTSGRFEQSVASATAPVVIVKLGATPGGGGYAQVWRDSADADLARVISDGQFQSASKFSVNNAIFTADIAYMNNAGQIFVQTQAAGTIASIVKGATSQTADLQQWQNSAGTVLTTVAANGSIALSNGDKFISFGGTTAPGSASSGHARLWYDDTAKRFKYIDSVGTTYTITAA